MSRARTLDVLLMYFVVKVQVFMFLTVNFGKLYLYMNTGYIAT
jgi:hypothetical protein